MPTLRTVTLNTGYDDHFTVHDMSWGGVGRSTAFRSVPSGKGISCARAALALGLPVHAYALVGDTDVEDYSQRLADEGLHHNLVTVEGRTRHNLTLVDGAGEQVAAHFVAPGFILEDPHSAEHLRERLLGSIQPGDIVTLNGSVPTGLPDDTWAVFAGEALRRGARVIVDAQGAAFREALTVPGVTAFKPNDEEILALPGVAEAAPALRVAAALDVLAAAGVSIPLVSRGEHGVSFLRHRKAVTLSCPVATPVASVMAGDAFVAGLAWGMLEDASHEDCIRRGLAAAAAHVAGLSGEALRDRAVENLATITSTGD